MLDDLLALGRSSCIGTTFLDLDDTMDELNIVQFLVHHQYIYNPSTGGKNDKGSLKIFKLIKITLKIYIYFFFFKNNGSLLLSPHVTLPYVRIWILSISISNGEYLVKGTDHFKIDLW